MTTICFDGTNLAVDSRVTAGGTVISDTFNKMFEIQHPTMGAMVCAVTGACDFCGPWLESISENGFTPVNIPGMDDEYSMSGLFIDSEGNCWNVSTNGGYFFIGKEPATLGSGTPVAQYLLGKGKSALNTVREVIASNLFCGGQIRVYNTKTRKVTIYDG